MIHSLTAAPRPPREQHARCESLASEPKSRMVVRSLGWFSVGLGAAELLAPAAMSKCTGIHNKRLLQLYGLREIAAGVGLLRAARPAPWLWARVAGDALDLAALAMATTDGKGHRGRSLLATAAVAGVTAIDALCALRTQGKTDL